MSATASPKRPTEQRAALKKPATAATNPLEAGDDKPRCYVGSVAVEAISEGVDNAKIAAFSDLHPVYIQVGRAGTALAKVYIVVAKGKGEEGDNDKTWFHHLATSNARGTFNLPLCKRLERSDLYILAVNADCFVDFQANYMKILAEINLIPYPGKAKLAWCTKMNAQDAEELIRSPFMAYISSKDDFTIVEDLTRIIYMRPVGGGDDAERHKHLVVLRDVNTAATIAHMCAQMGLSFQVRLDSVKARGDCILLDSSVAVNNVSATCAI